MVSPCHATPWGLGSLALQLALGPWAVARAWPQLLLSDGGIRGEQQPTPDHQVVGNLQSMGPRSQERLGMDVQISRKHAQIAEIYIGTPPQPLRCLIDSGSSDLWVPSSRCRHCRNNRYFTADRSSTFEPEMRRTAYGQRPRAVQIVYGSGRVTGYAVRDRLKFGSAVIYQQPFIIVEDAQLPPNRMWDGICGLGWAGLAQVRPTLYESIQAKRLPSLFSIVPAYAALNAFPTAGGAEEAHLIVGEVPRAVLGASDVSWVPAETMNGRYGKRGFWIISGGVSIRRPSPVPERFLVDTGTNQVLLVPPRHFTNFIQSLIPPNVFNRYCGMDQSAGAVCQCSIMQQRGLMPLKLHLGNQVFALPVSKMFMKVRANDGREICLLTIQPNSLTPQHSVGISDILGGLMGALFGPSSGSGMTARDAPAAGPPRPPYSGSGSAGGMASRDAPAVALPPVPYSRGLPADGGGPSAGEVVEDITYATPDGRLCKTTRVVGRGRVMDEKTACEAAQARRLQWRRQEELWMIGGVFLEHFSVIFDFDNARLGFARPVVRRLEELDELDKVPSMAGPVMGPGSIVLGPLGHQPEPAWPWAAAAFGGLAIAAAVAPMLFLLRRRAQVPYIEPRMLQA